MDRSQEVGIIFPEILVPDDKVNKKKWAVIACDQFTSNTDYWARTARNVGGAPSSLHIIVPEAFLRDGDVQERIAHAKETMGNYIEDGVLVRLPKGMMLVERETPFGTRIGLMLAVDLEQYDADYTKKPMIRATEQTVLDRVPPRMKLRDGAMLECPHIMLLIDDPKDSVIGPVYNAKGNCPKVYDTDLIQDGGHIRGWFVDNAQLLDGVVSGLMALKHKAKDGMLFAVGDGNHSLASAKAVWEEKKGQMSEEERETSPLRYALCEVVNLYDNGITMHPIHRMLFNVETSGALRQLVSILNGMGAEARMMYTRGTHVQPKEGMQMILFESRMAKGRIEIGKPLHDLTSMTLTIALDKLLETLPKAELDYIHGEDEFHELSKEHANLGFIMEPMTKDQLFDSVIKYGVLPRKSFSLGNAVEKRYYYECRLLVALREASEDAQGEPQQEAAEMQDMQAEEPYEEPGVLSGANEEPLSKSGNISNEEPSGEPDDAPYDETLDEEYDESFEEPAEAQDPASRASRKQKKGLFGLWKRK